MHDLIVILHYPESDWGDDLVSFHLPVSCTPGELMDKLSYARIELAYDAFDTPQDLADALCTEVAKVLGGSWSFLPQCGVVEIRED